MAYIPKSKIQFKNTKDNSFYNKETREPYTGPYMETTDGKFYVGHNHINIGAELAKNANNYNVESESLKIFGASKGVKRFNLLKSNIQKD